MSVTTDRIYNEEQQNLQEPVKKNPLLASFMNIVLPGLGYIYARRIYKGIFFYLMGLSFYILLVTIASDPFIFFLILGGVIIFFFYCIIDVFLIINKKRTYNSKRYDKWYFYISIIIAHFLLVNTALNSITEYYRTIYSFNIPNTAMSPTLIVDDKIIVKKTGSIKRNDIIVFMLDDQFMIKRCKGMPGDTLLIKDGYVIINNHNTDHTIEVAFLYTITTTGSTFKEELLMEHTDIKMVHQNGSEYYAFLTTSQLEKIRKISGVIDIKKGPFPENELFPYVDTSRWKIDNYGPIFIPKKGSTIQLTEENAKIYAAAIQKENELIGHNENDLLMNGEKLATYTFKQDHYFVMGDNRHNTQDSRYFGFVPEEDLFGKAKYIFWGQDRSRIGKKL